MYKTQLCLLAVTLLFQANTQAAAVVVNGDFEDDKKWEPGVRTELWTVQGIDYAGASDWSLTEGFGGGGHVDTGG